MTTAVPGIEQRRILSTEIPGPRSKELHDRRVHSVSAGLTVGLPAYIERAEGSILVDVDGNHLIDLGAGIAVMSVGHTVPEVTEAVARQAMHFTHTCFMVTPYEQYVEVCETLNSITPGDHEKRSALFNSGAEAVENAVKIARLATGRQAVVVVDHAYHGRTNLTMALTAKNMPYKDRFGPFAPEVYRVATSYPFRDGLDGAEAAARTSRSRARAGSSSRLGDSSRRSRRGARTPGRSSSPTRSRPASAGRVSGSQPSTRASSPTS